MKKIIGGKRYDTTTAKEVARWEADVSRMDFGYCEEILYLKRTGEYFLYGEGGGMSRYGRPVGGNAMAWGEKITPLTLDEAKAWAEEYLDGDEYEKIFEVEEENNTLFNVLLPLSLKDKLERAAEEKGVTMKDVVVTALEKYLE